MSIRRTSFARRLLNGAPDCSRTSTFNILTPADAAMFADGGSELVAEVVVSSTAASRILRRVSSAFLGNLKVTN